MKNILIAVFLLVAASCFGQNFYQGYFPGVYPANINTYTTLSGSVFLNNITGSQKYKVTSDISGLYIGNSTGTDTLHCIEIWFVGSRNITIGMEIENCRNVKIIAPDGVTLHGGGTNGRMKGHIDYVQVSGTINHDGGVGGWWIKTEGPDACNYPDPLNYLYPHRMTHIWFTHNQFGEPDGTHGCGGEAIYAGSTGGYGRDAIPCLGNQKLKPMWMSDIHLDSNIIYSPGRTGIQLSTADTGTSTMIGNYIRECGDELNSSQGAGIRSGYANNNNTVIAYNNISKTYIYGIDVESGANVHHNTVDSTGWNGTVRNSQGVSSYICYAQLPNSVLSLTCNSAGVNNLVNNNTKYAIYGSNNYSSSGNVVCNNTGTVSVLSLPFNYTTECSSCGSDTTCYDTTISITHDTLQLGHFTVIIAHDSVVTDVDTTYIKHLKNERYTNVHKLHTRTYTLYDTTSFDSAYIVKGGATHDTTFQVCTYAANDPGILYGYNGVWAFAGRPLSDPEVLDSLKTLDLFDIYRYPGGNYANSFNWITGKNYDGSGTAYTIPDVGTLHDSVGCDILFVLNMISDPESIFGALIAGQDLTNAEKAQVLLSLNAEYGRLSIYVTTFGASNGLYDAYASAGLKVALNINNAPVVNAIPNPYPTDLVAYAAGLQDVLDVYQPELVCIENEELNEVYYTGTPAQYIAELETAIPLCHAAGCKVADGGLLYAPIAALIYWEFIANGDPVGAATFLSENVPPSYWDRFQNPGANPDWVTYVDGFSTLIDYFATSDLDYVNFHIGEPANVTSALDSVSTPTNAINYVVEYLRRKTGKEIITNEIGQKNKNATLAAAIMQRCLDNDLKYAIWYSGDEDVQQHYKALTEIDGTIRDNGKAFAGFMRLSNQLEMLAAAAAEGIPIRYVELGNEFNNINNPGHTTYPTPQSYADEAAKWMDSIKVHYPTCKVAFIGGNRRAWAGGDVWNNVMLTKNPDALTWHESPNLDEFYSNGVVHVDSLNYAVLYRFSFEGMNLITSIPVWCTESNYTYEDSNIMSFDNQVLTSLNVAQTITGLISTSNHTELKIYCIRGIESAKQGAFTVTNNTIIRQATAYAMALWNDIIISQGQ